MLTLTSTDWILISGLALDIVGVLMVAIPDISWKGLRIFEFYRLREARNAIDYGGVRDGDLGFEDVVELFDEIQPNTDIEPEMIKRIEYVVRPTFVTEPFHTGDEGMLIPYMEEDSEIIGIHLQNMLVVIFRNDFDYPENFPFGPGRLSREPDYVYPRIDHLIRRGERTFRVCGFLIVATGFALQIASILMG